METTTYAPKTTLFCPQCWHESPVDGDWIPASNGYACPDCGTTITTRAVETACCTA